MVVVEFMELWVRLRELILSQSTPDKIKWKLTADGSYSACSAYDMFFLGRTEVSVGDGDS
jgi:hypothetical protein